MIQIDFLSFQDDHPHVTCYVTASNCLMIPYLVPTRYIVQIWDIEINFLRYHNPNGCTKAVDVLRTKYPEPPLASTTLPPPGFAADPNTYPPSDNLGDGVIENNRTLNGVWK